MFKGECEWRGTMCCNKTRRRRKKTGYKKDATIATLESSPFFKMQITIWLHISPSSPRREHIQLGHPNPVFWHHQLFTMYCYYVTARNGSSTFTRSLLPSYMISVSVVCCKKKKWRARVRSRPDDLNLREQGKVLNKTKWKTKRTRAFSSTVSCTLVIFFSIGTNSRLIICSRKKGEKGKNVITNYWLVLCCCCCVGGNRIFPIQYPLKGAKMFF